jgi:hypothetical protein
MRLISLAAALALPACIPCPDDVDPDTDMGTDTDAEDDTDAGEDTDVPEVDPCEGVPRIELTSVEVSGGVTLDGRCYHVDGAAFVSDGVLTLAPGTRISFAQDASLVVSGTGRITAEGTPEEPVELVGDEAVAGYWNGLSIGNSVSADNRIGTMIIRDASGGPWTGAADSTGALYVGENVTLDIDDLRVENAGNRAALVTAFDTDVTLRSLTVDGAGGPAQLPLATVATLEEAALGPDPLVERIDVVGATVPRDMELPGLVGVELAFSTDLWVTGGRLTVLAGAELTFATGRGIRVTDRGSLRVNGAAVQRVVIRGETEAVGTWRGIWFENAMEPSLLQLVDIRGAGGQPWTGSADSRGSLYITGASAVEVRNAFMVQGGGPGIHVRGDEARLELDEILIGAHEVSARVSADSVEAVSEISRDFTGNVDDRIHVTGGSVLRDARWRPEVPLVLEQEVFVRADLRIEQGTTVQGRGRTTGMQVLEGGSLSAVGAAEEPVVFEATESAPGSWTGLAFISTRSSRNKLDGVILRGGAGEAWTGNFRHAGNLALFNAVVEVNNTRFADSARHPYIVLDGSILTGCTGLAFENNVEPDALADATVSICE